MRGMSIGRELLTSQQVQDLLRVDTRPLLKDATGRYWHGYIARQQRSQLLQWGNKYGYPSISTGIYAIGSGVELWRAAIMLSHEDAINAYYQHLVGQELQKDKENGR